MRTFHFDPVRREQIVTIPGYYIWCGSMVRTPDGTCHLFLSMWEEKWGFDHGWATHSKIGYAVSDTPDGAYTFRGIVLEGSGIVDGWDRDSVHNPYILWHEGVFHLYYSGNYGDGTYASHIASQRVGVAYTTDPTAGFTRLDHPILPPRAGRFDADGTTNPSVCQMEDGRFLMIYKCWAYCGETKRVAIGAAFSDDPLGMWERMDEPIFAVDSVPFAAEDPCVYREGGRLYCLLKDMGTHYVKESERALIRFVSDDGISWTAASPLLFHSRTLSFADYREVTIHRLERPFLYLENDTPRVFFCAILPRETGEHAYNVHMNIIETEE